jgi:hypothetical protein
MDPCRRSRLRVNCGSTSFSRAPAPAEEPSDPSGDPQATRAAAAIAGHYRFGRA